MQQPKHSCPICFTDDLSCAFAGECGHVFCSPCLFKWTRVQPPTCPVCRAKIDTVLEVLPPDSLFKWQNSKLLPGPTQKDKAWLADDNPNGWVSLEFKSHGKLLYTIECSKHVTIGILKSAIAQRLAMCRCQIRLIYREAVMDLERNLLSYGFNRAVICLTFTLAGCGHSTKRA